MSYYRRRMYVPENSSSSRMIRIRHHSYYNRHGVVVISVMISLGWILVMVLRSDLMLCQSFPLVGHKQSNIHNRPKCKNPDCSTNEQIDDCILRHSPSFTTLFLSKSSNNQQRKNGGSGGGGFGSNTKPTKSSSDDTTIKKSKQQRSNNNNNKKLSSLLDMDNNNLVTTSPTKDSTPKDTVVLDKWGLPPPTLEDIFPPLPDDTVLIPVQRNDETNALPNILDALYDDIYCFKPSHVASFFNEDATERLRRPRESETTTTVQSHEPMKIRLVHHTPAVVAIDNFLSQQECEEIERIISRDEKDDNTNSNIATKVNSAMFTSTSTITKRTSTSWFCSYTAVPTFLAKARAVLNIDIQQMEEPQVVLYQSGQEFSWHYDEIPTQQLANGGQRIATILVYLNTVPRDGGGGTIFRDLKDVDGNPLTVNPMQGSALLFFPAVRRSTERYLPDDRTLHKGEVVAPGYQKKIIQMWIHEYPTYQAALPTPSNRQSDAIPAINKANEQFGYPFIS